MTQERLTALASALKIKERTGHADDRYHCQKARRRRADARGDRLLHQRLYARGHTRLPGQRAADGHRLARHDAAGDAGPDAGHDAQRRDARPQPHQRREGRQALHRRRGRQDLARPAADGGRAGRAHGEDVRPRPGAHGRHHRQAGELPRLFLRADGRGLPLAGGAHRPRHRRADRRPRPRRTKSSMPCAT